MVISSHSGASSPVCAPRMCSAPGSPATSNHGSRSATRSRNRSRSAPSSMPGAYGQRSSSGRAAAAAPRRRQPVDPHVGVEPVVGLLALDLAASPASSATSPTPPCRRCGRRRRSRRASGGRSCRPSRAGAARRTGSSGSRPAAVEGERVGVAAELARGELVQRPGVADLVLGDRREGDVLLERRRDAGPLRVAPAEDQLVVGGGEEEVSPAGCPRAHAPP